MGTRMRKKRHRRKMKGISPDRPKKVETRRSREANCIECNVTIDYYELADEPPVKLIACPNCKIIFNVETGEVVARN